MLIYRSVAIVTTLGSNYWWTTTPYATTTPTYVCKLFIAIFHKAMSIYHYALQMLSYYTSCHDITAPQYNNTTAPWHWIKACHCNHLQKPCLFIAKHPGSGIKVKPIFRISGSNDSGKSQWPFSRSFVAPTRPFLFRFRFRCLIQKEKNRPTIFFIILIVRIF